MNNVVPCPVSIVQGEGWCTGTSIRLTGDAAAGRMAAQVLAAAGIRAAAGIGAARGDVVHVDVALDPAVPGASDERYELTVADAVVRVRAPHPAGLFYGVQTLVQLAERVDAETWRWARLTIRDHPRYAWRGLSVDIARHFFGPPVLRQVIDLIARYKFNVLHLHLTDDQSWRLSMASRPELTQVTGDGAVGGGPGGFLTAQDYAELQAYAAERHVRIVPEFDVPGHTNAVTHTYGALVPGGEPTPAYTGDDVGFSTLTFDVPGTETFLRDVFGELAAMTVGDYLHIGGDEALSTTVEQYAAFVEFCERIVLESGKRVVGWQELAKAAVRPGTVIQLWDTKNFDRDAILRAADGGARFLMSPAERAYLDMKYAPDYPLGQDWAACVELRDAYDWEPERVIPGLAAEAIVGVEAAIWTETLRESADLFVMLLPRLAAIGEIAWSSPESVNWDDFRRRVATHSAWWLENVGVFHPSNQVDWS